HRASLTPNSLSTYSTLSQQPHAAVNGLTGYNPRQTESMAHSPYSRSSPSLRARAAKETTTRAATDRSSNVLTNSAARRTRPRPAPSRPHSRVHDRIPPRPDPLDQPCLLQAVR